jgi:DNA-binding transcriptional MerR regulator
VTSDRDELALESTEPVELTVDELAQRAGLPVRTIREYQTIGVLPAPDRRGRTGIYRATHVLRLQLIARLQERGYSLAGIRDLLGAWRDGSDLPEVLGLTPDQLVHLDEPGVPATLDQLTRVLPTVVPDRLDDLVATGVIEASGAGHHRVPSPSLLQLLADLLDAGYAVDEALALLTAIHDAADAVADAVLRLFTHPPDTADPDRLAALASRGRGLLAHGTGRLTIHLIGRRLADTAGLPAKVH